ncbi:MAG: nitrous oxide reductase accessory protein NosL [Phycisphaerae bacterium]|jgi:copper chaperone NosL
MIDWGASGFRIGLFLCGLAAAGCGRAPDLSPPAILYGETECETCKMIVSEERFAAAACVVRGRDVHKAAFDDVGCLLQWLGERPPAEPALCYVHDLETRQWIEAARATFVRSEQLQTPMASNLGAFATSSAAAEMLRRGPGTILDFEQLRRETARGAARGIAASEGTSP